ncbi:MAG: NADH-quinone oxidoreductase subunit L, partial [Deltaproteobacteria bacterium]|nr:NADH-quinone oxidoreductase subunit L [Deltaproteobacteria bacterium]
LANKYWVDEVYDRLILLPFRAVSGFLSRVFDVRVVDGTVLLPGTLVRFGAAVLSLVQAGSAQLYLYVMIVGALIVFWTLLG